MGGDITVESASGAGTKFIVRLPAGDGNVSSAVVLQR